MKKFFKDENGQGLVEYGLIIALIAIAAIAVMGPLGDKIKGVFSSVASTLPN